MEIEPTYGWLTDYETGETIRAATKEEWLRTHSLIAASERAGADDPRAGVWIDDDGRAVCVDY